MRSGELRGPAVIVDPYSSGGLYAPAFRGAGISAVAVLSRPDVPEVYASSYHPEDFDEIIVLDDDRERVVRRLRELSPRCVLAGTETGVELADALAAEILPAVANPPELAPARRHKWGMAQAAAEAGLPVLAQICTNDAEQVAAWLDRERLAGRDLVVKPPLSASTDGVTRVRRGEGWRAAFAAQLGQVNQWGRVNEQMLVQEYASGTEYVVDTFSHDGRHTVADVCRYHKVHNATYMAVYDSMEWVALDDPDVPEIVEYTRGVLDAVGMRFGAAHVEVMQTDRGPRLIELNARPHGAGHPRFSRVATGDSQVDRAVRYFAGLGAIPDGYELSKHVLVVFLISRSAGVVRRAETLDAIEHLPSHHFSAVHVKTGDVIEVTKDLLGTLSLGFAVLAHEDRDQVLEDYAAVRALEAGLVLEPLTAGGSAA